MLDCSLLVTPVNMPHFCSQDWTIIGDSDWRVVIFSGTQSSACPGSAGSTFFTFVNQDFPLTHLALASLEFLLIKSSTHSCISHQNFNEILL